MSPPLTNSVHPEFDPDTDTYEVRHDSDSPWSVSTTLVLSLSALTGDGPRQMRSLSHVVDPDVLDSHVRGRSDRVELSFEFHGHRVTVRDDGQIEFSPLRDGDHRPPEIPV